jgi:transposase
MPNRVRVLTVPDADRAELERRARSKGAPARVVERARIVLLAADGLPGAQIAERAGCTEPTVIKWRRQYAGSGLAGLEDAPRPGGPKTVLTEEVAGQILAATVTPPPESLRAAGVTHWSSRRLADWLRQVKGISVSHDSITVLWRKFCLVRDERPAPWQRPGRSLLTGCRPSDRSACLCPCHADRRIPEAARDQCHRADPATPRQPPADNPGDAGYQPTTVCCTP